LGIDWASSAVYFLDNDDDLVFPENQLIAVFFRLLYLSFMVDGDRESSKFVTVKNNHF